MQIFYNNRIVKYLWKIVHGKSDEAFRLAKKTFQNLYILRELFRSDAKHEQIPAQGGSKQFLPLSKT